MTGGYRKPNLRKRARYLLLDRVVGRWGVVVTKIDLIPNDSKRYPNSGTPGKLIIPGDILFGYSGLLYNIEHDVNFKFAKQVAFRAYISL